MAKMSKALSALQTGTANTRAVRQSCWANSREEYNIIIAIEREGERLNRARRERQMQGKAERSPEEISAMESIRRLQQQLAGAA